jgi:hypothetical protein
MTNLDECVITVPVVGGIFGVGRLATRLKALADTEQIGPWHFGHLDACGSRQDPRRSEAGAASIGSIASPFGIRRRCDTTLRWREMDSNPRSPVGGAAVVSAVGAPAGAVLARWS